MKAIVAALLLAFATAIVAVSSADACEFVYCRR